MSAGRDHGQRDHRLDEADHGKIVSDPERRGGGKPDHAPAGDVPHRQAERVPQGQRGFSRCGSSYGRQCPGNPGRDPEADQEHAFHGRQPGPLLLQQEGTPGLHVPAAVSEPRLSVAAGLHQRSGRLPVDGAGRHQGTDPVAGGSGYRSEIQPPARLLHGRFGDGDPPRHDAAGDLHAGR